MPPRQQAGKPRVLDRDSKRRECAGMREVCRLATTRAASGIDLCRYLPRADPADEDFGRNVIGDVPSGAGQASIAIQIPNKRVAIEEDPHFALPQTQFFLWQGIEEECVRQLGIFPFSIPN